MITETQAENTNTSGNSLLKKNRIFGMPMGKLTRNQRLGFNILLKVAYENIHSNTQEDFLKQERVMKYSVDDFLKILGIDRKIRKNSHIFAYRESKKDKYDIPIKDKYSIEASLQSLTTKELVFRYKDENDNYTVEMTTMLSYFKLTKESIEFQFSDWILKHIYSMDSGYFLKLNTMSMLTSTYEVALFEQIEQRRGFGVWHIEYELLRKLMGVEDDKYARYSNFSNVIKSVVENLSSKTEYNISYETKRKGRKVHKLIFHWHQKKLTRFDEFKNYIRAKHIDEPLYFKHYKEESKAYTIGVSSDGYLYDMISGVVLKTEISDEIWREMYKKDHSLLIDINVNDVLTLPKEEEDGEELLSNGDEDGIKTDVFDSVPL